MLRPPDCPRIVSSVRQTAPACRAIYNSASALLEQSPKPSVMKQVSGVKTGVCSSALSCGSKSSTEQGNKVRKYAYLACGSWARRTHTAINYTSVALAVAIGSVIVRVGVGCTCTRFEKGGSRSIWDVLFRVVANRAGTLVTASVIVVEEHWQQISVRKHEKRIRMRK